LKPEAETGGSLFMKTRKMLIIGTIIGALLVFAAALPTLISTHFVKQRILERINRKLSGKLRLEAWSLHWFAGQRFDRLTYGDSRRGLNLEIRHIRISKGLLALLTVRNDLGSVEIKNPLLTITRQTGMQQATPPGPRHMSARQRSRGPGGPSPGRLPNAAADLKMQLKVSDGRILLKSAHAKPLSLVQALELKLQTTGAGHPVSCRLTFSAPGGRGRMSATVDLPRGLQAQMRPEKLALAATVGVKGWPLGKLFALLPPAHTAGLQGSGRLQADFRVNGNLQSGLRVRGHIAADDLQLTGGALGTDHPFFKQAAAAFNITAGLDKVDISQLDLTADGIEAHATGQVSGPQQNAFSGRLDLDLAKVAALFPSTLRLQKGLVLSAGRLNAVVDLKQSAPTIRFRGQASVNGLAGTRAGRRIVLKSPLQVSAKGRRDDAGLYIDDFALKSAYIKGDGRGDPGHLQLHLSADVRPAIRELKQFIRLEKLDAGGRLKLSLTTRTAGRSNRRMTIRADTSDFHLSYAGAVLIPRQRMKIDASADLQPGTAKGPQILQQVEIDSLSWLGKVRLRAKRLRCTPGNLQAAGLDINARLKLGALAALLHRTRHFPEKFGIDGRATLLTAGDIDGSRLTLAKFIFDARGFRLRQGEKRFHSKRLNLAARGRMDFAKHALNLPLLEIGMDSAHARLKNIVMANWQRAAHTLQASMQLQADLKPFLAALRPWLNLPQDPRLSGHAVLNATARRDRPGSNGLELNLKLAPISAFSGGRTLFSQPRMVLSAAMILNRAGRRLTIKHLKLDSQMLSLDTAGALSDTSGRRLFRLKGSLRPNLEMLAPYISNLAGFKLAMTGNRETPFDLQAVLPQKGGWQAALRQSRLAATLTADTVAFSGLAMRTVKIPVRLEDGRGATDLEAVLNDGRLNLPLTLELSHAPPALRIPDRTQILADVHLTRAMADKLLSHIHPIFKDVSSISGSIGLTLAHFNWPLTQPAGQKAVFSGSIDLKNVKLEGAGLLAAVTGVLKMDGRRLKIDQQRIDFSARGGRITASPLRITIRGHEIVLAGSVGMDRSLAYTARAPVTRRLVGKEAYRYLKGTTINLPIRGTLSHPDVSTGSVADAVKDLVRQSVEKSLEKNAGKLLERLFK